MAVKDKKARFNPFVLPSDFFKSDGDPVYTDPDKTSPNTAETPPNCPTFLTLSNSSVCQELAHFLPHFPIS